ncbi:immunoglobulin-like domain-containing protein [Sunxiuqinia sp. A32]|uniref:immunoglobulin-like domain-containing protein n=1 Tax=Sunxiuqinia sp. A32 TaxID=3461496 RepID=UPI004045F756
MKILKYSLLVILSLVIFSSCEKDYDSFITKITYYPTFELEGGNLIRHQAGTPYTDLNVIALEGETEIDVTAVPNPNIGEVDYNTPGIYAIDYFATNVDGYDGTTTRYVIITNEPDNNSHDLSGTYVLDNPSLVPFEIVIEKNKADGTYNMGSFYGYEKTYGDEYKMPVRIVYVEDGLGALMPMVDLFGYYLTASCTIAENGDLSFSISRDGNAWSSRVWRKVQ